MSDRDVRIRIGRVVVSSDGAVSAADLEAAIGEAIRLRLEGATPADTHRSLADQIADSVLGHPQVASAFPLPDRGRLARPAHSEAPPTSMSMSGRDARGPQEHDVKARP